MRTNSYLNREAFNIVVMFWIFCGFMLLSLSFTVVQDERRVQEKIKESLLRKAQESLADEEPRNMLASPSRADTSYVEILDENIDSVLAHPVDSTPTAFGIPTRSEGYKRNPLFSIEHTHIIEYGKTL